MTAYTVRIRGGGLTLREYRCPEHGVFEALAPRDAADEQPCPAWIEGDCPCGECEGGHECGEPSPRCFTSAPAVHTQFAVSVSRGKIAPSPSEAFCDTRPLAEGMPKSEWKKERAKMWNERRRREFKDKGMT